MSTRIVIIDLFQKQTDKTPVINVTEKSYTGKIHKTLPYMTEAEMIEDRIRCKFYETPNFEKTPEERSEWKAVSKKTTKFTRTMSFETFKIWASSLQPKL